MSKYAELLKTNIESSIEAKKCFLAQAEDIEEFSKAVTCLVESYKNDGRIYIAGNGGSAADAQHLAAEFVSKLARDRDPLAAEALTVDTSALTAIGNDYGYDEIFARQISGKMRPGDVFLAITTSGNSPNILRALEVCRELCIPSILFTGHQGGKAKSLANYCIIAAGKSTATIQELHIVLAHSLCECVEVEIFG
jgi:D-sedoheptulose 7-phosphate isomerase